jgi:hypothetical protein
MPDGDPPPDGGCTSDEHCDDGDPCTDDTCNTELAECEEVDADGDGTKIGSDVRVTVHPTGSFYPAMAWTGSEYGLRFFDGRDYMDEIQSRRVSATGTVLASPVRVSNAGGMSSGPDLVWALSTYGTA